MYTLPDWESFFQKITDVYEGVTSLGPAGIMPAPDPYTPELHPAEAGTIQALDLAYQTTLKTIPGDLQDTVRISLLIGHARALDLTGDWPHSLDNYNEALHLAASTGNRQTIGEIWRQIGRIRRKQGRWNLAQQALEKALQAFNKIHDFAGAAAAYNSLGAVLMEKGELRKAQRYFEQALEYVEDGTDYQTRGQVLNNLGIIANMRGQWDRAITYYQEAITFYDRSDDQTGVARAYQNLGMTFADREDWLHAAEYFEKSLDMARLLGDRNQKALVYLNKIEVYIHLADLVMALLFCRKCIQIFAISSDIRGLTEVSRHLGTVYRLQRQWPAARKFFDLAIRLAKQHKLYLPLGETLFEKGLLLADGARYAAAVQSLEASIAALQQAQALGEIRKVRKQLLIFKRQL